MLANETLTSKSYESAVRTVRGVVAKIRERIDADRIEDAKPKVATNDLDAMLRRTGAPGGSQSRPSVPNVCEVGQTLYRNSATVLDPLSACT
jgi:hypothetical protein